MSRRVIAAAAVAALALAACGGADDGGAASGPITLVVYDSWPADAEAGDEPNGIQAALADFTAETGIEVDVLVSGDAGTMLSKASLTAGNPEGDVMWGVDNTLLSRAIDDGVFEPYGTDGLNVVPAELTALVPGNEATPVDFGDVCVNYDIAALAEAGVEPPTSLASSPNPSTRAVWWSRTRPPRRPASRS